jgi:hypothetical protein
MNDDREFAKREIYCIEVQGRLDERWSEWFDGMEVAYACTSDGLSITTLTGPVVDQVALRGILSKIWDLNLVLRSVSRTEMDAA